MAESVSGVSSTNDPYSISSYTPEKTSKNTLSIESYFKLLAAQLANQDMSNPMDTSDMMNQMSQMAMVQALASMTETTKTQTTLNSQSYGASMVGKEVTVNTLIAGDAETEAGTKTGVVESVFFSGEKSTITLKGDSTEYPLENIVSMTGSAQAASTAAGGTAASLAEKDEDEEVVKVNQTSTSGNTTQKTAATSSDYISAQETAGSLKASEEENG